MLIASLFTIAKIWNLTRRPTADDWIKKMWYIHTIGVLFNHKEE
jgi:hypothetical protein